MFKQIVAKFMHLLPQDADRLPNEPHWSFLRWLMPNGGTLILLLLYIGISRTWGAPTIDPTLITSATEINFSGYLADDNGNPLTGNYEIKVAIYDQATDGTVLWGPETHLNVPVTQGNWTLGIGSVLPGGVPTALWTGNRYLQITVAGEVLSPRQLIRSVPIAGLALTVPDGSITQNQAPFAPKLYYQPDGGSITQVSYPIIYSGWFHGGSSGQQTLNLSGIFSQIDAVTVTKTRTSGGVDTQVTFKVTDASGLNKPTPSEIKISAYGMDGNAASWIQAYVVITGR